MRMNKYDLIEKIIPDDYETASIIYQSVRFKIGYNPFRNVISLSKLFHGNKNVQCIYIYNTKRKCKLWLYKRKVYKTPQAHELI